MQSLELLLIITELSKARGILLRGSRQSKEFYLHGRLTALVNFSQVIENPNAGDVRANQRPK